jgi:ubiquinone/menaquinone biosynthesis C-methylase UbiE
VPEGTSGQTAETAHDAYVVGHHDDTLATLQRRTLAQCGAFLIPHLRAGQMVLDCGCGPGSLTVELAERVEPGVVVGVDIEERTLAAARALAASRGVSNVRFEIADVYRLPYADRHFDVVYSHALISHLSEPYRGLREMRRVLKPGGVAAVIDHDPSTYVVSPSGWPVETYVKLFVQYQFHLGSNRLLSRHLRGAMIEAGFTNVEMHAGGEGYGTAERLRAIAALGVSAVQSPDFAATVVREGWISQPELDALPAALLAWGERPDGYLSMLKCGGIGWVPSDR